MGTFIDITGQQFGRLKVVCYEGKSRWICECLCGNTSVVYGTRLRNGITKSCGCLIKEVTAKRKFRDRTGERYGRLVVLSYAGGSKWLCECTCGNRKEIDGQSLKSGATRSCGCLLKETILIRLLSKDCYISKTERLLGDYIENEYHIKLTRPFSIENRQYDMRYKNILIESDGRYWHSSKRVIKDDAFKTKLAKKHGYTLIRFELNNEKEVINKWPTEIKPKLDKILLDNETK